MSLSSRKENDATLLNLIQKIYTEREQLNHSPEKFQILSDRLYQIWMRPQTLSNINNEGYAVVNYLEELIVENQLNDDYFSLIISLLAKNEYFYQSVLHDQKRFERLFHPSISKSDSLSLSFRYLALLYSGCPTNLIPTVGLEFYRFVVENYAMKYLRQKSKDTDGLAAFSSLIYQFHENIIKHSMKTEPIFIDQQDAIDYSINVIDTLLHYHVNIKINQDLKLINTITKAIGVVWEQYPFKENQQGLSSVPARSIEYLFDSMSHLTISTDNTKPTLSSAILPLFPSIQLDLADITLKVMFSDGRLNGEGLSIMIKCLIELIDAPIPLLQHMPYETWITGLCNALVTFHQHEYLRNIIDERTSFFIDHLFHSQTSDNAFQILSWFILYDKRLQTFRLLLDRLPNLFEQFQINRNEELKTRIIELCHMGMAIHPDYDLSNEIILKQIIHNLPQPDLNILANHRTTHARFHSIVSDNEKKIKNRLGILNLGNTCYVSSVLQALYQCDLFRKDILEHQFTEQIVLKELQILLAQLYLSKRPYVNAINLVKIARPAWFTINEQQDCAEFLGFVIFRSNRLNHRFLSLGYLLDTIKDEEKKNQKSPSYEIERLFTIRTRQINRCQNCSIESYREESSNYLFLPIPTSDHQNEQKNYNQSALPISLMKNGLKFYAASNGNSTSEDQAKSIATSLVQSERINRSSPSNSSIQSRSPPPSYSSLMNQSLNLQFVFDCYFQKEELKDENQYRCEHCRSLQNAERRIILQTAPEYLILSLNRFEYDKTTNVFRKVFTKINYPKVLHVPIYPSQTSPNHSIVIKYCLILVIVHTGYTLHGGHYYVYARELKSTQWKINMDEQEDYFTNDEWFLLNDDLVTLSSYEAMIENCAQYTSATPYILFYKRIDEQRMEEMERTKQIDVHESLIKQIHEDNMIYEREKEK